MKVFMAVIAVFCMASFAFAGTVKLDFENGSVDKGWQIKGKVEISDAKANGGKKALVVGEDSEIKIDVDKTDKFGKVTMSVYDNGFKHDHEKNGFLQGPYWGIKNSKGEVLMTGVTFKDHTTGDKLYNWTTTAGGESDIYIWWMDVKRKEGWHKWEFIYPNDMDSIKIVMDGESSPGDWTFSRYKTNWTGGFNGIVIKGNKYITEKAKDPFCFDDIEIETK